MDDELIALLDEMHRYGVAHDAGKADRLERLRNVEPDTAQLLAVLIRAIRPRAVLELGTSNGYSTLWLADAVRATNGHLVSTDIDPERSAQAARNLDRAELRDLVELRVQDAAVTLREASDATWDMIFLDAEPPAYTSYWPDLVRVLKPGGLLVVSQRDLTRGGGSRIPRTGPGRGARQRGTGANRRRSVASCPRIRPIRLPRASAD